MRLFTQSLSDRNGVSIPSLPVFPDDFTLRLTVGQEVTQAQFYFFMPYKSADFPMITGLTKTYFFLYSTDHAGFGGTCYWGEGDNLDLSDFTEKGVLMNSNFDNGVEHETPFMINIDGQAFLYFHSQAQTASPSQGIQHTNLFHGSGGLTNMDLQQSWTYVHLVLGFYTTENANQLFGLDENHTGYLRMRERSGAETGKRFIAHHLAVGGSVSQYRRSESDDGINWNRLTPEDEGIILNPILCNYPQTGVDSRGSNTIAPMWKTNAGKFRIITTTSVGVSFGGVSTGEGNVLVSEWDNQGINQKFASFFFDNYYDRTVEHNFGIPTYYDFATGIGHCYRRSFDKTKLYYATYDISNIDKWKMDYSIYDENKCL